MYSFHIVQQIENLIEANVIKKSDVEKARRVLDDYWTDKIAITWSTEDVMDAAKSAKVKITKEDARKTLNEVFRKHDATIGVNWDVLSFHVSHFPPQKGI